MDEFFTPYREQKDDKSSMRLKYVESNFINQGKGSKCYFNISIHFIALENHYFIYKFYILNITFTTTLSYDKVK